VGVTLFDIPTSFPTSNWLGSRFTPAEQYGPLLCYGAPARRRGLHQVFEQQMLPPSLPIHQMLTLLSLLDLHCSPHQFGYMTLDVDQKHLGKRMREHIKRQAGIRIGGLSWTGATYVA
jgi:hypothetical protein